MARISTVAQKRHMKAMELLKTEDRLLGDQKDFIYENFHEGATNLNGISGAFFTPRSLANDFAIEVTGKRIIDLCAGIGMLSHACTAYAPGDYELTCVEFNPEYVEAGKKLLPNATWHCESVTNITPQTNKFDVAISNPPFGKINGVDLFDLEVVRIASTVAKQGVFIMPQQSTPFRYSGKNTMSYEINDRLKRWMDKTGIEFTFNCGIDTSQYLKSWKGVSPAVEIVLCDFA